MREKLSGKAIEDFVGLRPKMYSDKKNSNTESVPKNL